MCVKTSCVINSDGRSDRWSIHATDVLQQRRGNDFAARSYRSVRLGMFCPRSPREPRLSLSNPQGLVLNWDNNLAHVSDA